jgi:hypothetical protein
VSQTQARAMYSKEKKRRKELEREMLEVMKQMKMVGNGKVS